MPNPAKGARLYAKGKGEKGVWIIRDGSTRIATGCRLGDRASAEIRLAEYIAEKHKPERGRRDLDRISIADVISIYLTDIVSDHPSSALRKKAASRAERLILFFGSKSLADLNGALCRAYVRHRGNEGGSRRDLQDLSAAIQHHHREGYHRESVRVWLPPKGARRERWLTRSEIARLVWAAWSFRSAMPIPSQYQAGTPPPGSRRPGRHIARAILFAYYTGSRPGDVLRASFHAGAGRSYIDLDSAIFYRLPQGKRETNKRQPPCRIGDRLLSHLKRWKRLGICASYVVEYEGAPIKSIKTGLSSAAARAGLAPGISAYVFRHSRATHLMQASISTWAAAEALGTGEDMIRKHYGHHSPDAMRAAVNAR